LEWLDQEQPATGEQRRLFTELSRLNRAGKPFLVLDGGQVPTFLPERTFWNVGQTQRAFQSFPPATEPISPKGKNERRGGEIAQTFMTGGGSLMVGPWRDQPDYDIRHSLHFLFGARERHDAVLVDVNTYRLASSPDLRFSEDRERAIVLSSESIRTTAERLEGAKVKVEGPVICAWGRPLPSKPNFVAFPPPGYALHYKLELIGGKPKMSFVKLIR
jgi:hypothetical protein